MLPFDYQGRDWRVKNRFGRLFLEVLLAVGAILLLPFTLLALFLWGLSQLAQPRTA
jgi:hypothetical protein